MKKMQSNDLIILEAINGLEKEIITLKQDMNQKFEIVQAEIQEMKQEIRANTIKIEGVQNSINWGFAGMTIAITAVIAVVGLVATLAPTIREYFASKLNKSSDERMKEIAESVMSKALAGISR